MKYNIAIAAYKNGQLDRNCTIKLIKDVTEKEVFARNSPNYIADKTRKKQNGLKGVEDNSQL